MKILNVICFVLLTKTVFSEIYDSYLNYYKDSSYSINSYKDIANTTWKEFFISENAKKLVKCIPANIDNDSELDLLVLDSETRLYW
jgi:hypothetical protein